jgi:hypothetical protein
VIEITPPQLHMHLQVSFSAGVLPIITVMDPGTHGAVVTGMQGMGVSTPKAAAVALATIGLAMLWHIPNGGMFTMGMWSMIVADGVMVVVMFLGRTTRVLGAIPKLHCIIAPIVTSLGMA